MPQSRLPIAAIAAAPLEQAIERLLSLDLHHADLLTPLVGKHIVLDFKNPGLRLHLAPSSS